MEQQALLENIKIIGEACLKEGLQVPSPYFFDLVSYYAMDSIVARNGFPKTYSHWIHGQNIEILRKQRTFGLSEIFELVINNHPFYAYLKEGNEDVCQKLVIAHVFGHMDFFKQNMHFQHTKKNMLDQFGSYASLVDKLEERHGKDAVEDFI